MHSYEELQKQIPQLEQHLGYVFNDKNLLTLAFVHRSFYNEHRDLVSEHNERLEFLGDSVFGLIVSDFLYSHLPQAPEGHLSHLRAQIVEASSCAALLLQLKVADYVLLGKGERLNDGRGRETILADLFEALLGAIYLDGGLASVQTFFLWHFEKALETHLQQPTRNWKAELQDYSQKRYQKPPVYKVLKEEGPDHSKVFTVGAFIDDASVGEGVGASKKEAEQAAAENALTRLEKVSDG